jgi:microcompartment protein CcmK/EutM
MRIGEVIGRVVLSRCDSKMLGGRFMIVWPFDRDALIGEAKPTDEPVVAYEQLGATNGTIVAFSEGREAAMPFYPDPVALDAYVCCLIDELHVDRAEAMRKP